MLKKILLLLIFICVFCCGCNKSVDLKVENDLDTIKNRGILIVGVKTDVYPFGYKERGHYMGFDPALGRLIAKGILGSDKKIKFVPVTATNRMMKLYSNEVDMIIATMSVTPKRKEILDFSTPYYTAGQALLVRKGSKIKMLKDLNKKKAIIVFGSTSEMSLRAAVPNVIIIGYKTYDEAYLALKNGKAEAIVSDDSILLNYALKDSSLELLPKKYSKEPYAIAFRKGKESKELINAVNDIIQEETKKNNIKTIKKNLGIKD